MSTYKPEKLDYDESLFERLDAVSKEVLLRFYNNYQNKNNGRRMGESAHTKRELRQIIAANLEDQIKDFLCDYEKLRDESIRTSSAIEHISTNFSIDVQKLDIDTRYELLIFIYEEDLNHILNDLIVMSKMRTYSSSRDYILTKGLELSEIKDGIRKFHKSWNNEMNGNKPARVKLEYESENEIVLKILREVSSQSPQTFKFREKESEEIPTVPEITTISYYKLKTVRVQVISKDDETELVFSDSFTGWQQLLPKFFDIVFNTSNIFDKINRAKSDVAGEIEDNATEAIDKGNDPVRVARNYISSRKEEAKDIVSDLDIPKSRKENLKQRISSIKISGSEITGDQSIETQEFRLIAGLDSLFSSVDIEEGFKDMIEKSDPDKQSFVLTVDERPVEIDNGEWSMLGGGQLRDLDRRALEIFFDKE